jgi:hypothetical protein
VGDKEEEGIDSVGGTRRRQRERWCGREVQEEGREEVRECGGGDRQHRAELKRGFRVPGEDEDKDKVCRLNINGIIRTTAHSELNTGNA